MDSKESEVNDSPLAHSCDICNKSFKFRSHLKQHQASHTSVKPFSCDVCSKSFKRLNALARHKKNKHSNNVNHHTCPICHKSFSSKQRLKSHAKSQHRGDDLITKKTSLYDILSIDEGIIERIKTELNGNHSNKVPPKLKEVKSVLLDHMKKLFKKSLSIISCCNSIFTSFLYGKLY